jgi:hypothetical protein
MTKRAILDMGLTSIERVLNHIQTYFGSGDKPHLKRKETFEYKFQIKTLKPPVSGGRQVHLE